MQAGGEVAGRAKKVKSCMARLLTIALSVSSLSLAVSPMSLQAATSDSATARVSVVVPAQVRFEAQTRIVQVPVRGLGEITAEVSFRVQANVPTVRVQVEATPLFYAGNPDGAAIPVAQQTAVRIVRDDSRGPGEGGARVRERLAAYAGESSVEGWPARKTEAVELPSGRASFNEDLGVTITWELTDPTTPAGQYVGKVRLTTFVGP